MRNKFLLISFILLATNTFCQYSSEGEPRSRFRGGIMWFYTGIRPAEEGKVRKYDRLIFDIVYNDWTGDQSPFKNHWSSIGLNTSFMFDIPLSKRNNIALGIGVSHQLMRIRHDNQFFENDSPAATDYVEVAAPAHDKNILAGNMFAMPVELRFRKKDWRHFKFHIGGKIGYQANMFSKYVYDAGPNRNVVRDYGFPDLNRLVYGAHVRIGLRNWALYASYNFNTLFSSSESTALNQIQFGLSLSLY